MMIVLKIMALFLDVPVKDFMNFCEGAATWILSLLPRPWSRIQDANKFEFLYRAKGQRNETVIDIATESSSSIHGKQL